MAEKSLDEVVGRVREFHDRGLTALHRQNFDYAIEMFNQALALEPGFYDCREALRTAQFKKSESGGVRGFLKKMLGTAGHSPHFAKAQIALRTNPTEAIYAAEQILNTDPANVTAHKLLAEAALACGFPRTAVLSLEIAFKNSPEDRDLALRLAENLGQAGRMVRSEKIYTELLRAFPNDPHIAQALKNVTAERTMTEGGYEVVGAGEGSYRDMLKDREEAVSLEQGNREVRSREVIEKLLGESEARLAADPANLALLRTIAGLHVEKEDFDGAISYYRKILATEGITDPGITKAIVETTLKKFDHAISRLDPAAPDDAAEIARIQKEKFAFQMDETQKRAERYPNDLQICFELGDLHFQAGNIAEATREFQKAMNNPHRRIAAMSYLGQCFAQRGMHDLAARRFRDAIKEKPVFDEEKKELIYCLGTVLENMGSREEAIEQFKQVYEVDIGYRDVAAKVDAYYAGK
jgi:tetratricopeptide (TPR) repeat protein